MKMQSPQFSMFTLPQKKQPSVDLKNTINRYLFYWPLFVIGIIFTISLTFFYLKNAKAEFEVKASLLIQDRNKTAGQQSALHEIDLINSSKIIENEIEILKSNQLISQVVQDLQLWITYQRIDGFLSYQDLYKSSPVKLTLIDSAKIISPAVINIIINDENSFFIKMPDGKQKEYLFKNIYKNSLGTWKLEPTEKISNFNGANIKIAISNPENLVLQLQKSITVALSNKLSTAVVLTTADQVSQRGIDVLNKLISNYNSVASAAKTMETKRTLDFLDHRIDSLAVELMVVEKGIEGFKSSRGLTDISANSKVSLENMQANDSRLNEVKVQLNLVEGIERFINSSKNSGRPPATIGITDPALSSSIEKLELLQLQRDRLLATTPETNPDFDPINRQIATTRSAIKENVKNIRTSLQNTQAKLQLFNSRLESSIKIIPTEERQYISIKRQQTIKENLYTYLLQKREEVSVSYASSLTNDRIVDRAYSGPPKLPAKSIMYAIAFVLGISLPAAFIYGKSFLNDPVTTLQQIKDLEIPIVTELPFKRSKNPIAINENVINATTEQFRTLRTKLYHLYGNKEDGRVTLITSSIPGEGKSFVSSNLGVAMAYADRKTIILELDMRKPKIAEIFNLSKNHAGISDLIKGHVTETEIIQNSGIVPNLDIITCGSLVNNPCELLERIQLKELIFSLKNTYDDIILDSSPIHLVPDAMILSRLADLTLYIIRQGFTQKSELDFLKELHLEKQLPNINLIFNGIERVKYGYGYDYSKHYYNPKKNKGLSYLLSHYSNKF